MNENDRDAGAEARGLLSSLVEEEEEEAEVVEDEEGK